MANISSVFGSYVFNFEHTKLSGNQTAQAEWLENLAELLQFTYTANGELIEVVYATRFEIDCISQSNNETTVPFTADGRWSYTNNISWFESQADINSLLLELDGLQIHIDYVDYEFGMMQILPNGDVSIQVTNNQVVITDNNDGWQDLTPKSYLDSACGDFCDMLSEFSLDEYDLTDEQLHQIAKMDDETFNHHWQDNFAEFQATN